MREKISPKGTSVIFFIAILIGCQKDYFDPEYFEKNYIIQNIPKISIGRIFRPGCDSPPL